jgi:hypothetical protein
MFAAGAVQTPHWLVRDTETSSLSLSLPPVIFLQESAISQSPNIWKVLRETLSGKGKQFH